MNLAVKGEGEAGTRTLWLQKNSNGQVTLMVDSCDGEWHLLTLAPDGSITLHSDVGDPEFQTTKGGYVKVRK